MNPSLVLVGMFAMLPLSPKHGHKPAFPTSDYKPVAVYDDKRDPAKDLHEALAEAKRSKRRVLLEVGGDWCLWCHIMDNLFDSHPGLAAFREEHYVRVKIDYSQENPNEAFLSHYPRISRYPHFFVLDAEGNLVCSQDTRKFENGQTYNARKVGAFLKRCTPAPSHSAPDTTWRPGQT